MRKWICIGLTLVVLSGFSLGCTGVSKETKVKCPKCGAVFTVDEGLSQIQKYGY